MKTGILCAAAIALTCVLSCSRVQGDWTKAEKSIINSGSGVMRILTVEDSLDNAVLRSSSIWLSEEDLQTKEFATLSERMLETLASTGSGVGIAGPQVGILRRVVAVQRCDKEDEPVEVFPNISIIAMRGEPEPGPEGCLSVPDCRGEVLRYRDIDIKYTSPATLCDTVETIQGFTAVIFQHEVDHLVGILYTDKAVTLQ